jgi:hypothetical protein
MATGALTDIGRITASPFARRGDVMRSLVACLGGKAGDLGEVYFGVGHVANEVGEQELG